MSNIYFPLKLLPLLFITDIKELIISKLNINSKLLEGGYVELFLKILKQAKQNSGTRILSNPI